MDSGQSPSHLHLSPRPELRLQGPRPSPLRVSKESHKIRKPPLPPPTTAIAPLPESRDPVIIYTISPKVIHVERSNFMDLVQRLTGPDTPPAEAISPAAKLATIHRTMRSPRDYRPLDCSSMAGMDVLNDLAVDFGPGIDRLGSIPGILSPVPANLPPISPAFFSPSYLDSSFLSFLHELSPAALQTSRPSPGLAMAGGGGGGGGSFWNSYGNFFSPSVVSSPGVAAWDLFNQFSDF